MILLVGMLRLPPPIEHFDFSKSANVIESVTTATDTQLQRNESGKLTQESKRDTVTKEWIDGDGVIGE